MSADPTIAVRHAPESERYEALADGMLAGFAAYRAEAGAVVFVHTDVDDAFHGRGVGGALVREALADVRRRGLNVVPMCPFVAAWIRRHPDYADLVPEESRHLVDVPPGGG